MGLGGTEITKQAADIILKNDDFGTIVVAVEEGRRVYDNIVKFILYLLSCNSAEIFVMLIAGIIGAEPPFTVMMVSINKSGKFQFLYLTNFKDSSREYHN